VDVQVEPARQAVGGAAGGGERQHVVPGDGLQGLADEIDLLPVSATSAC
jgi:hypothetical protein